MPPEIKLRACFAHPKCVSAYRFLVNGNDIKYITVEPGVIPPDDLYSGPALKSRLPTFPPGNWNEGHVAKNKDTGNVMFTWTVRRDLPAIENIWHNKKIDHLQLKWIKWVDCIRQNVYTCPLFEHPIVYKYAEFPWLIRFTEKETRAYGWIDGHGIGPRFLGHVTEDERVIGFLLEHVTGRTAEVEDFETTVWCEDENELLEEFEGLREKLEAK